MTFFTNYKHYLFKIFSFGSFASILQQSKFIYSLIMLKILVFYTFIPNLPLNSPLSPYFVLSFPYKN